MCCRPQGSGRALKLGGKKDVESFVDQLKSEGERMYTVCIHTFLRLVYQLVVFDSVVLKFILQNR